MNKNELKIKLDELKVNPEYYSLNGGNYCETFCLAYEDKWKMYYSERGVRIGETEYECENDACNAFYEEMKNYANTMPLD